MKHSLKIHSDPKYVEVVGQGKANADDFGGLVIEVATHPDINADTPLLNDFRELDVAQLAAPQVEAMVSHVARHRDAFGRGRWAVVVNNDVGFGLARMWSVLIEDRVDLVAEVFRDMDVALDWLLGRDAENARKNKSS